MYNNSYYGNFRNRKFSDIWGTATAFISDVSDGGLNDLGGTVLMSQEALLKLYYLLYAEYGNSVIASDDEEQFKYQIYSVIFEYGPSWYKRLDIQKSLRALTQEEIETGSKQIFNRALNPGNDIPTSSGGTPEELTYINEQTTQKIKRGKVDAYATLWELLKTDVTREFITKFKKYFLQIVLPEKPLWYLTQGEDND